jgi:predicted nucleic acid-binding protein
MKLDELKPLIRAGSFGAITLDTSIFVAQGLRLESGLLRQLKQFQDGSTRLIISEVIKEEVLLHLTEKAKKAQTALEKDLKDAKDFWQVKSNEIEDIKKRIFGEYQAEEIASRQLGQFTMIMITTEK